MTFDTYANRRGFLKAGAATLGALALPAMPALAAGRTLT